MYLADILNDQRTFDFCRSFKKSLLGTFSDFFSHVPEPILKKKKLKNIFNFDAALKLNLLSTIPKFQALALF